MCEKPLLDVISDAKELSLESLQNQLSRFPLSSVYFEYGRQLEGRKHFFPRATNWEVGKALLKVGSLAKQKTPEKARQEARQQFANFLAVLKEQGVNISIQGEEHLQGANLLIANHQHFGLEALGAYHFLPDDGRVVMKEELTEAPVIGKGLQALDPITFDRKNKRKAVNNVMDQVRESISTHHPVLIFPQGTRTDGNIEIKPLLLHDPIKALRESKQRKIAIITAHVQAFASGKIPGGLFQKFRKTPIRFQIDAYHIPLHNPEKERLDARIIREISKIMKGNLYRMLAEDIQNLD